MTISRTMKNTNSTTTSSSTIVKRIGVGLAAIALAGGAAMGAAPQAGAAAPEQVASSGGWQQIETPAERPIDSVLVEDAVVGDTVLTPFLDLTVGDVDRGDGTLYFTIDVCATLPDHRESVDVSTDDLHLVVYDGETQTPEDARPVALAEFEDFEAGDIDRTLRDGDCFSSNATVKVYPDTAVLGVAYSDGDFEPGSNAITWRIEQDG